MPNIKVGYMDKKINSTKTTFSGTTLDCKLKEPCSMVNPTFAVMGLTKGELYNYCSFEGRYYYINDIEYLTNDIQAVHCTLDALATYKSEIKETTGYCNFGPSSLAPAHGKILDSRFEPDVLPFLTPETVTDFNDLFDTNGCVIMRIIDYPVDCSHTANGGVKTIVGSLADYEKVINTYASGISQDIAGLGTDFEKLIGKLAGLGNALDAIKSAVWVPFKMSLFYNTSYTGNLGGYDIGSGWYLVGSHAKGNPIIRSATKDIPIPTQAQTYRWLLHPKYTKIELSTPFGTTSIEDTSFMNGIGTDLKLLIRFGINIDGDCFLDFRDSDNGKKLGMHTWNCAVNVLHYLYKSPSSELLGAKLGAKAAKAIMSPFGMTGGSLGLGAAVATPIANGVEGIAATMDITGESGPMPSSGSGIMSMYCNADSPSDIIKLSTKFYMPEIIYDGQYADYCNEYGWPISSYKTMNVNGFYQMAGASCSAKAPSQILSIINSTINSGIIIED